MSKLATAAMDLNIFKKHEPSDTEHYWALVVGHNWVQSAIWRVVGDKSEVVAEGSSVPWEEDSEESLVVAADSSLSSAASGISEDVTEPNKVVFGLPPSWIIDGNITSTRLNFLKKVSNELELTPAGFVVLPEAIAHYLKSREGAPLNAILVGPSDASIDVTLVQNGKILGSAEVAKSISIGEDVAEGLAQIGQISQYPSRILLYNHKQGNLDDARAQLLDTEWKHAKISFMHTPKVDVLPQDVGISAVSLAGGAEIAATTGVILPHDENFPEDSTSELPDENLPDASDVEEVSPEELGFLEGVDVAEVNDLRKDTQSTLPIQQSPMPGVVSPRTAVAGDETFEPVVPIAPKKSGVLSGFVNSLSRIFKMPKMGGFKMSEGGQKRSNTAGVIVVILLALVILGGGAYWYLPRATFTIFVSPKLLEKVINIKVDPSVTSADVANHIVPGQTKTVDVTGDKTTQSSGTKTIGEAARGTVTIYHVGAQGTLKSGTSLAGPNNLKFTLDQDVSIASASSIVSPSKAQALVTSDGIGPDFNLSSNTEFTVSNFSKSDYVARNDVAFSGGTSRSVTAVSDEDRASLKKSLTAELNAKGLEQIKSELGEDEILVDDSASFESGTESFNAKSGDEAATLKLSLAGKVKALVVPKSAMNELVKAEIQQQVPPGFLLRDDQIEISYKAIVAKTPAKTEKKKDTKTTPAVATSNFEATIKANLLPQVKPDDISKGIAGKRPQVAYDFLEKTIPGFSRAETTKINFRLPGSFATLPMISKNITIEVSSER